MVASRQVEIPYYRAVGKQRGKGFGAVGQVIGRTAIPFLRKYVVPAVIITGSKTFKTAAMSVGKQTLKKQLGEGSRRRKGAVGLQ